MTAPEIRFDPPLSASDSAASVKVATLTGSLKVTSILVTAELRGFGDADAIDVTVKAGTALTTVTLTGAEMLSK